MNRTRELELVAALLAAESTLALASTDESGLAAVAPLFYIADEEFSLYWVSSHKSPHSQNVLRDPRVAVTVYKRTDNWREICGVQLKGKAYAVTDPMRRKHLIHVYNERFDLGRLLRTAVAQGTLYVFHPDWLRYIDNSRGFGYRFELTFDVPEVPPSLDSAS